MYEYNKVFSRTRFRTASRSTFHIDHKRRRVMVGSRTNDDDNTAFVGKIIEQGKSSTVLDYGVYCDTGFPHVIGVFGSRGSGKSFDLGVFLEEIFCMGAFACDRRDAAVVFDIQDQFWTLAHEPDTNSRDDVSQRRDLQRWGLETGQLYNVVTLVPEASETEVPNALHFSLSADQVREADYLAILELDRFSPMGQALLTVLEKCGNRPPDELARACVPGEVLDGFQQGTVDGLRWRLESLARTRAIADDGIAIDDLLQPGRLSVFLMRNTSESVRALIVGVIARLIGDRMGRIQQARKVRRRIGNENKTSDGELLATRVWTVVDEAHVLVPSEGRTSATAPLVDYVKRGRDAGLSLIFATQQPSAVSSRLLSQVDLTLTHTLGFEADVVAATNRMPTRNGIDYDIDDERGCSMGDVIRSLDPGEAVLADGSTSRAFLVKIRPRCTAHGGGTPS